MHENVSKFIKICMWMLAIVLLIRCLISSSDIKVCFDDGKIIALCYNLFGYIGEAIGITTIVMLWFNQWGWRLKWIRLLHEVPVLASKYKGTFISDFDNVERNGTLTVSQTFLNVSVVFKTDESNSRCMLASFSKVQGQIYLIYIYQNEPRAEIQDKSPIHYGTTMLNVSDPSKLEGNYYNGRKYRGSMILEACE